MLDLFQIQDGATSEGMRIGLLAMRGCASAVPLDAYRASEAEAVGQMQERFGGMDRKTLRTLPPVDAYAAYYKKFGQNYPLIQQLESVLRGDKGFDADTPLVSAMFAAELASMLLTAGHDLEKLNLPIRLCTAEGGEPYTSISGRETAAVGADAYICDADGILSSILRGPDQRTRITADTTDALYTIYAPAGVGTDAVLAGLDLLEKLIRSFAPGADTVFKGIASAQN